MATIHVDGKQFEVDGADNLLHACLSLGLDIPYFCWHPALGSVGACRQCAVKQYRDKDDTRGKIVMSCMTPSTDGTYISIDDAEASAFRESIIEFLMSNHPHDCPVCAEGGHCHLQDMTVMTGHASRHYRFTKRTHRNQDLGPFIQHEMNRCIACYRCVRYYGEYAGGTDLGVFGTAANVYFGRETDGVLESEFSGNLTEVCPTGVFTDKTHSERYNRKWDMQYAPSVCTHCSLGCNVSPGERYGEIRRIENRYNEDVNHYFLCDRGRFGYGYTNRRDRPRQALLSSGAAQTPVSVDAALAAVAEVLQGASTIIGIGSPRASIESNFALLRLVGEANFSSGMSSLDHALSQQVIDILGSAPITRASLRGIERCTAALVLGEDVMQTAPRVALALRQTARNVGAALAKATKVPVWQTDGVEDVRGSAVSPLFIATPAATRIDNIATGTLRASPDELAALGHAVARLIDEAAPAAPVVSDEAWTLAQSIANALLAAEKPLVVSGTGCGSAAVLDAAANVAIALQRRGKTVEWMFVVPEANTIGTRLLGGCDAEAALERAARTPDCAIIVLENDLYRQADTARVDAALLAGSRLIVVDHQATATAARAKIVLPTATVFEADGTLINNEGRAQRFFQVFEPAYYDATRQTRESWRWLEAVRRGSRIAGDDWATLDDVTDACAASIPALAAIPAAAPGAEFRIAGLKIAREPHRYSGRTAMRANISVHEPRTPQDVDTALAFSMEGYNGTKRPAPLIPYAWAPRWNSPQAWNKFQQEVGGRLREPAPSVLLLLAPASDAPLPYRSITMPAAVSGLRAVALYRIYGSEELSARAPVMRSRIEPLAAVMHPDDATAAGLGAGDAVEIRCGERIAKLPLALDAGLARGCVGVPAGFDGLPRLAGAATVARASA